MFSLWYELPWGVFLKVYLSVSQDYNYTNGDPVFDTSLDLS